MGSRSAEALRKLGAALAAAGIVVCAGIFFAAMGAVLNRLNPEMDDVFQFLIKAFE